MSFHKLKSKLSFIVDFAFKEEDRTLLDYLIMVHHTGGRKHYGFLVLVKHHLKQL